MIGPLTNEAVLVIAADIAKLPSVPRQILKDIPRAVFGQPERLSVARTRRRRLSDGSPNLL
jgi:hypothetical protein